MAQFFESFSADTVGAAPSGLTVQYGGVSLSVVDEGGTSCAEIAAGTDGVPAFASYDAAGEPTDVEVLVLMRRTSKFTSPEVSGVGARMASVEASGYVAGWWRNPWRELYRADAGVLNGIAGYGSVLAVDTTRFWVRLRASGETISFKAWLDGSTEPSEWLTTTDATYASGLVGIWLDHAEALRVYQIGVGTDGDPAPTEAVQTGTAPTAALSTTTDGLTASVTDESTDPDGDLALVHVDWGDGHQTNGQPPGSTVQHTYASPGDYTVTLTAEDAGGLTDTAQAVVSVAPTHAAVVRVWTGAAWEPKPLLVWDGQAWVSKPLKRWDGAQWVPTATS